jgi:hypothetical protein
MSALLIVLALIVLSAFVLAVELLRPEPVSEQGLADLNQSLTGGRDYERMPSLFEENLSADRGRLMRQHLKQLRGDFLTAWAVCRLLAPISRDANPAPRLLYCWLRFHWLFATVWARTYWGSRAPAVSQANRLLTVLANLRRRAAALMHRDAALAANGSRAWCI